MRAVVKLMRQNLFRSLSLACCLSLLAGGAFAQGHAVNTAASAQAVLVPTAGNSTSPEPLRAFVFNRTGTASARHPAVVMVHGCGGVYGRNGRDGQLNARHAMWGEYLAAQGYVALMLDSFSSRGFQEICANCRA